MLISKARKKELKFSLYLILKSPLALAGLVIILILVLGAIFAPWVAVQHPKTYRDEWVGIFPCHIEDWTITEDEKDLPPSYEHPFGTNHMGRDIFSMVLYGARGSLRTGLVVVVAALLIGICLGLISGYFGKRVDEIIMRITDIFMSIPGLVLAIAFTLAVAASIPKVDKLTCTMIALSLIWWPSYARIVRGQVLSTKERLYIEASRALGAKDRRIIFNHILPNSLAPVIVAATMDMGKVILIAAGLSFIGAGAQAGTAEWGLMVAEGSRFLSSYWWHSFFPGLAIFFAVLGFNLFGDGLRDILDPKLRRM
ncbi:MAG: ABC transporter permease [Candidatus Thermoplasmatota archaeon]|nr:ABC transporter permease [Candidatus Thermoplasmatota archaeon]